MAHQRRGKNKGEQVTGKAISAGGKGKTGNRTPINGRRLLHAAFGGAGVQGYCGNEKNNAYPPVEKKTNC